MATLKNKLTGQVVEIEDHGVATFARDIADAANWVDVESGASVAADTLVNEPEAAAVADDAADGVKDAEVEHG